MLISSHFSWVVTAATKINVFEWERFSGFDVRGECDATFHHIGP